MLTQRSQNKKVRDLQLLWFVQEAKNREASRKNTYKSAALLTCRYKERRLFGFNPIYWFRYLPTPASFSETCKYWRTCGLYNNNNYMKQQRWTWLSFSIRALRRTAAAVLSWRRQLRSGGGRKDQQQALDSLEASTKGRMKNLQWTPSQATCPTSSVVGWELQTISSLWCSIKMLACNR